MTALRLDCKISGPKNFPAFAGGPSIFSANLLCDDQLIRRFPSTGRCSPSSFASFPDFQLVRAKSGLASASSQVLLYRSCYGLSGYSQHWVALTHINQEWIRLSFIFCLWLTARACEQTVIETSAESTATLAPHTNANKQSAHNDTILALLFLIAGVFATEYFIGLEPLRFLFIWVIVSEEVNGLSQRLIQTLKRWTPYLLIWLANAAWLAYFYTVGTYDSYDVEVVREPLTILHLFSVIIEAIWKAGFYIWGQVIVLAAKTLTAPTTLDPSLIAIKFIFFFFILQGLSRLKAKQKIRNFSSADRPNRHIARTLAFLAAGLLSHFIQLRPLHDLDDVGGSLFA